MGHKYTILALLLQTVCVYCYIFISNHPLSMNEAEQYCRLNYKSTLASLHNDNDWGNGYYEGFGPHIHNTTDIWIGLVRDLKTLHNWSWTDQSAFNYSLWDLVNPLATIADCTVMNQVSGHWDNAICSDQKPFLCNDINTLKTSPPTTYQPTISPSMLPTISTGNYGVSVKVTFEYIFTKNETNGIIIILDGITKQLVNDTINSNCILSNNYKFDAIKMGTKWTIINGTILVCDEVAQEELLVAIVDNSINLQTTLITNINKQINLNINIDKTVLQIDCIYMCDGELQTTSYYSNMISTINEEYKNAKEGSTFWYIMYVIGSMALCCVMLLCLMTYIRFKKQKLIDSEKNVSNLSTLSTKTTKGRKQSGYYIETTEMSPRSKDTLSIGFNIEHNEKDNDNDEKDVECTNTGTKHDTKHSHTMSNNSDEQETNTNQIEGEININKDIGENIITIGYETVGKLDNENINVHNDEFIIEDDEDKDFGNTPKGVEIQKGMGYTFDDNNSVDERRRYSTAL
eukprot:148829_1